MSYLNIFGDKSYRQEKLNLIDSNQFPSDQTESTIQGKKITKMGSFSLDSKKECSSIKEKVPPTSSSHESKYLKHFKSTVKECSFNMVAPQLNRNLTFKSQESRQIEKPINISSIKRAPIESFLEDEILQVGKNVSKQKIGKEGICITVYLSENRKTVIQQLSSKAGGTTTVIGMLAMDNKRRPNVSFFLKENFFNVEVRIQHLKKAGFTPVVNVLSSIGNPLLELQKYIEENGSAIVDILHGEEEKRVIIVDEIAISLDHVRIRDPQRVQEIVVTGIALMKRLIIPQQIIQIPRDRNISILE